MELMKRMNRTGRHIQTLAFTALALLFTVQIQAKTLSAEEKSLFIKMEIYEALGEIAPQFNQGLDQSAAQYGIGNEVKQTIGQGFTQHLSKGTLSNNFDAAIAGKIDSKAVTAGIKWYSTDLAKRFNDAENAVNTAEAQQEMMGMAQQLMADAQRVAIEQQVIRSMSMAQQFAELQKLTALAIIENLSISQSNGQAVDLTPVEQQLDANMPAMTAQLEQYLLLTFLYSHKDFTLEELKQYEAFNTSEEGKAINTAMTQALVASVVQGMVEMSNATKARFQTVAN